MKKTLTLFLIFAMVAWGTIAFAASGDPVLVPVTIDQIESTDKSGQDGTLITGTAGTSGYTAVWNADGDLVDGYDPTTKANVASPTFTGTVTIPTPFTIGAVSMTATGTQLNYLASATGTTGTTSTNLVFSDSPTITSPTISTSINLPAGAIDAITEIAAGLKSGADTKLITGTAGSSGNLAVWNADGDIVDGGSPSGTPGSFGSPSNVTIASGVADLSAGANFAALAGEGGAADDLTEIQGAAAGDVVVLSRQSVGYTITVKDGTYLKLQADFALDGDDDTITLICSELGTNDTFREITRSNAS